MAASFRLSSELESILQFAVKHTGKKRSQLIRDALNRYCSEIVTESTKSPYERLMASGFTPIEDTDLKNLAANKAERRRRLRARVKADNR